MTCPMLWPITRNDYWNILSHVKTHWSRYTSADIGTLFRKMSQVGIHFICKCITVILTARMEEKATCKKHNERLQCKQLSQLPRKKQTQTNTCLLPGLIIYPNTLDDNGDSCCIVILNCNSFLKVVDNKLIWPKNCFFQKTFEEKSEWHNVVAVKSILRTIFVRRGSFSISLYFL